MNESQILLSPNNDRYVGHDLKMDIKLKKQMVNQQTNYRIMHQDRF